MEHKSNWKNFLLFAVFGLLALHINVSEAVDGTSQTTTSSPSTTTSTDDCVLEAE